jgi:hypothetical protein
MIVDASKADLDSLAREAKALEDRKKALTLEEARLGKKVAHEADCKPAVTYRSMN